MKEWAAVSSRRPYSFTPIVFHISPIETPLPFKTKTLDMMLRRAASHATWTTIVDGECKDFNGIFEESDTVDIDGAGKNIVVRQATLLVTSAFARNITERHVLKDHHGTSWVVFEKLKQDGGDLTKLYLTRKDQ